MRHSILINWKEFLSSLHEILIPCGWFISKNSEIATYSLYTGYKIHGKRNGGYDHINSTTLRENLSKIVDYGAHILTLVIKLYKL